MLHIGKCVVVCVALAVCAVANFPDNPKACKYGDSECIKMATTYLLHQKSSGDPTMNLQSTDPMTISSIHIKQGEESPLNIDLKFKNNKLYGFKHAMVEKVKGFDKDLTKKHEIHMIVPSISLVGEYTIFGKVLILPISGEGTSNITLMKPLVALQFNGSPVVKDGATYMQVSNLKFAIKPERVTYNFQNLFNGDKELGDNMNMFLNENWKEIFDEARVSIVKAFSRVFQGIINDVFGHLPYDKLFIA